VSTDGMITKNESEWIQRAVAVALFEKPRNVSGRSEENNDRTQYDGSWDRILNPGPGFIGLLLSSVVF
jgi:hypothetical protein